MSVCVCVCVCACVCVFSDKMRLCVRVGELLCMYKNSFSFNRKDRINLSIYVEADGSLFLFLL